MNASTPLQAGLQHYSSCALVSSPDDATKPAGSPNRRTRNPIFLNGTRRHARGAIATNDL